MERSEKISIITTVYNECDEWLRKAIESILNQTYRNIEFVIVNDNPGNTRIAAILSEYAARDDRILLVPNEHNLGRVGVLNKAVSHATGEYIAVMDADDYSYPERLEIQLDFIHKSGCDFIAAFCNIMDENSIITAKASPLPYDSDTLIRLMRFTNPLPHPLWLVKREVYERLNGYREIRAAEDYEFMLRAAEIGVKFGVVDSVLLDYRIRSNGISMTNVLRQRIVAEYLSKNMQKVSSLDCDETDRYVTKRLTERAVNAFARAVSKPPANNKRGIFEKLFRFIRSCLMSKYFRIQFYRKLRTKRISNRFCKENGIKKG